MRFLHTSDWHLGMLCNMVGIISHVQVLRDNIPTKLEAIKSNKGSKIKTIVG